MVSCSFSNFITTRVDESPTKIPKSRILFCHIAFFPRVPSENQKLIWWNLDFWNISVFFSWKCWIQIKKKCECAFLHAMRRFAMSTCKCLKCLFLKTFSISVRIKKSAHRWWNFFLNSTIWRWDKIIFFTTQPAFFCNKFLAG